MPPPAQTINLDTIPVLPPLSFQRSVQDGSAPTSVPRRKPVPGDLVTTQEASPLMQVIASESSSPPTPELLRSRSSTGSNSSSRPPTPGHDISDAPEHMSTSTTPSASHPANALGLSHRRRFKGEHLNLKIKETPSPSTLSPRSAFLSPFLSPSLTPRTSLLDRMSGILHRAPSPASPLSVDPPDTPGSSAKLTAMRETNHNKGPFGSRRKEEDPLIHTFWPEEMKPWLRRKEFTRKDHELWDFGAYIEPGPHRSTMTKNAKRSLSVRWPPINAQTVVYDFSIPVRRDSFSSRSSQHDSFSQRPTDQKPITPVGDMKVREQKRQRRTTQIHSAHSSTSSKTALPHVRGRSSSGVYFQVFPSELQSRLLSVDVPCQQLDDGAKTVTENNQARQIGELIDLMAADISGIGGDSSVPNVLPGL